jgi:crotonobetainyl-CoA:carnitine CoA-transferase CaiB-like acyl-CoA transferase
MAGPLSGIKVVEMGVWVAGPSCACILADWGADVESNHPTATRSAGFAGSSTSR